MFSNDEKCYVLFSKTAPLFRQNQHSVSHLCSATAFYYQKCYDFSPPTHSVHNGYRRSFHDGRSAGKIKRCSRDFRLQGQQKQSRVELEEQLSTAQNSPHTNGMFVVLHKSMMYILRRRVNNYPQYRYIFFLMATLLVGHDVIHAPTLQPTWQTDAV